MSVPYDYDLLTIGAGSGGVRASRLASEFGAKVALVEEYRVGGTCVIRGCVPKKLFVYASHFAWDFEDAAGYGWQLGTRTFSWEALQAAKDKEIDRLNKLYVSNLERAGVSLIKDRAVLRDPHTVFFEREGREVTARVILIATGSWPVLPKEGAEHGVTSNEVFELPSLPRRVVIVGGGYIAVEFAGIFNGLGVETVLLYRGEKILRGFDEELRGYLGEEMVAQGIDVRVRTRVLGIKPLGKSYEVMLEGGGGGRVETDLVMFATGRKPRVSGLGLEACGVKMREDGAVIVDSFSRSSVDSIYAIGDVSGRVALTPAAIREGEAFARTVFGGEPTEVNHRVIPTAVFSQPALGVVGLTETQARETCEDVEIYKSAFRPLRHTLTGRQEKAFMKLVVVGGKVVGVHIMGADAGELIQVVGIAVTAGVTKSQFDETLAVHPTLAEELVTLR